MKQGSKVRHALTGVGLACVSVVAWVSPARADAVADANKPYTFITKEKRSDLALLPLLMKMTAAPASASSVHAVSILPVGSPAFTEIGAWASQASQQAVLTQLGVMAQEKDFRKAFAFGLPYGPEGVPPDLIRGGMYVELGDPPTLATAQFLYLPAIERMEVLVHAEATRLLMDGKPNDAIDVLINLTFFARQMADREMATEARWGMTAMTRAYERMRDVAYLDLVGARKLSPDKLRTQITRLEPENAYLDMDRMRLPEGDKLAAKQIVDRLYSSGDTINADLFAGTMAKLGTAGRPLRLFGEAARWKSAASTQASGDAAREKVNGLFVDWSTRWRTNWFDRVQGTPTVFSQLDESFAAVKMATPDVGHLRLDRRVVQTENIGTRASLAVVGHTIANGQFPPQLSSVRPRYLPRTEADPFNANRANGNQPPPEYFLPMRAGPSSGSSGTSPHDVNVVTTIPGEANVNFSVKLKDDVFCLYSLGSDNAKNFAKTVQNTSDVVQGADYLIFPPVISLYRQYLIDRGDLK
jgi:hypothetical protein